MAKEKQLDDVENLAEEIEKIKNLCIKNHTSTDRIKKGKKNVVIDHLNYEIDHYVYKCDNLEKYSKKINEIIIKNSDSIALFKHFVCCHDSLYQLMGKEKVTAMWLNFNLDEIASKDNKGYINKLLSKGNYQAMAVDDKIEKYNIFVNFIRLLSKQAVAVMDGGKIYQLYEKNIENFSNAVKNKLNVGKVSSKQKEVIHKKLITINRYHQAYFKEDELIKEMYSNIGIKNMMRLLYSKDKKVEVADGFIANWLTQKDNFIKIIKNEECTIEDVKHLISTFDVSNAILQNLCSEEILTIERNNEKAREKTGLIYKIIEEDDFWGVKDGVREQYELIRISENNKKMGQTVSTKRRVKL